MGKNKKGNSKVILFSFWLNFYFMSLIIGAGILALPSSAGKIGFLPFIVILGLCSFLLTSIYNRWLVLLSTHVEEESTKYVGNIEKAYIALKLEPKIEAWKEETAKKYRERKCRKRGQGLFNDVFSKKENEKYKLLANNLLLWGMLIYCITAVSSYFTYGTKTMSTILKEIVAGRHLPNFLIGMGPIFILFSIYLWWKSGKGWNLALFDISFMEILCIFGILTFGMGIIYMFMSKLDKNVLLFLLSIVFLLAILISFYLRKGAKSTQYIGRKAYTLLPAHSTNSTITLIEVCLLFFGISVGLFIYRHNLQPLWDFLLPNIFQIKQFVVHCFLMMGTAIFSLVGVAIFNLPIYWELFGNKRKFHGFNCRIPMIFLFLIYSLFTFFMLWIFPVEKIMEADQNEEFSILLFKRAPGIRGLFILLPLLVFALLAVTNACKGYLETIKERAEVPAVLLKRRQRKDKDIKKKVKGNLWFWGVMLMGWIISLLNFFLPTLKASSILSLGGGLGSVCFLIALPYLAKSPEEKTPKLWLFWFLLLFIGGSALFSFIISLRGS